MGVDNCALLLAPSSTQSGSFGCVVSSRQRDVALVPAATAAPLGECSWPPEGLLPSGEDQEGLQSGVCVQLLPQGRA